MEKGSRAVQPKELVVLANLYNRNLHGLLRHGGPLPEVAESEAIPLAYQLMAVEAFHEGQISEGELARYLRQDRLSARELYQSLRSHWK